MGIVSKFLRRRAARAYVYKLGPWLRRSYGASQTYTAGQIERGARDLRLDRRYIVFGYAVFLDAAAFESMIGKLPEPTTLAAARTALREALDAPPGDPARETNPGDIGDWSVGDIGGHDTAHHAGHTGVHHSHGGGQDSGHGH